MKKFNYCASVFFGIMAVVCGLTAIDKGWTWFFVAGICGILSVLAWQDYVYERDNEDIYKNR